MNYQERIRELEGLVKKPWDEDTVNRIKSKLEGLKEGYALRTEELIKAVTDNKTFRWVLWNEMHEIAHNSLRYKKQCDWFAIETMTDEAVNRTIDKFLELLKQSFSKKSLDAKDDSKIVPRYETLEEHNRPKGGKG